MPPEPPLVRVCAPADFFITRHYEGQCGPIQGSFYAWGFHNDWDVIVTQPACPLLFYSTYKKYSEEKNRDWSMGGATVHHSKFEGRQESYHIPNHH